MSPSRTEGAEKQTRKPTMLFTVLSDLMCHFAMCEICPELLVLLLENQKVVESGRLQKSRSH